MVMRIKDCQVKVGSTGKQGVCPEGFGIGMCVLWEKGSSNMGE